MDSIKCVLVGDDAVGKTCLITRRAEHAFPSAYIPSVYCGYATNHAVNGRTVSFGLWDTSGDPRYDAIRPLSYPQTDVFIICFSIVDPESYEHVRTKWGPEIAFHNPRTPALIVGTKSDLRADPKIIDKLRINNTAPIQPSQGAAICSDIGVEGYMECSAFTGVGVERVFEEAIRIALSRPTEKRRRRNAAGCVIT